MTKCPLLCYKITTIIVGVDGLAAARSHSRSNNTPCCYSLRSCHFVTSTTRPQTQTNSRRGGYHPPENTNASTREANSLPYYDIAIVFMGMVMFARAHGVLPYDVCGNFNER